jgi:LuxR family maltose regulon positive regulatory protein
MSCSEFTSGPESFIAHIVGAIRESIIYACSTVNDLLLSADVPSSDLTEWLLYDIAELGSELLIVFDDVHEIEDTDTLNVLRALLERGPASLKVVLVCRNDPMLPLARRRVQGDLLEVRATDLRMNTTEASQLLENSGLRELPRTVIEGLVQQTEGWPTGLRLAAMALIDNEERLANSQQGAPTDIFTIDFLVQEVLGNLKPDIQTTMTVMAVLGEFNAALVDAIVGKELGTATLAFLQERNVFLVPLDAQREWFRFHHLLRDVLREDGRHHVQTDVVLSAAATWFLKNGRPEQAMPLMARIQSDSVVAQTILPSWLRLRTSSTATECHALLLRAKDHAQHDLRWLILAAEVSLALFRGEEAAELLDRIGALLPTQRVEGIHHDLMYVIHQGLLGSYYHDVGGPEASLRYISAAIERLLSRPWTGWTSDISDMAHLKVLFAGLCTAASDASVALGNRHAIDHWLRLAYDAAVASGDESMQTDALFQRLRAQGWMGCLNEARVTLHQIENSPKLLQWLSRPSLRLEFHTWKLRLAVDSADLAIANDEVFHIRRVYDQAPRYVKPHLVTALQAEHRLWMLSGNRSNHRAVLELFRSLDFGEFQARYDLLAESMEVAAAIHFGDRAFVLRWMSIESERGVLDATSIPTARYDELLRLCLYLYAGLVFRYGECLVETIDALAAVASQRRIPRLSSYILPVVALWYEHHAATDKALKTWKQFLNEVVEEHHVSALLLALPESRKVQTILAQMSVTSEKARRVLEKANETVFSGLLVVDFVPSAQFDLTPKEKQALQCLLRGFSNRRIAEALHVGLPTVKTHLRNLYEKLGVHSRSEAVAKARLLDLHVD